MKKIILIALVSFSFKCFSQTKFTTATSGYVMCSLIHFQSDENMVEIIFSENYDINGDTTYEINSNAKLVVKWFMKQQQEFNEKIEAAEKLIMTYNCTYTDFTPKQKIKHDKAQKEYVKIMGYKITTCCKNCK